jgi:Ca2+-binding EF-hand superfamily protein
MRHTTTHTGVSILFLKYIYYTIADFRPVQSDALNEEELLTLKRQFSRVDTNGDGTIDVQELGALLSKTGRQVPEDEVQRILKKYDTDHSGSLNFDEFVEMILMP